VFVSNPAELERRLRDRVPTLHFVSERRLTRILRTLIDGGARLPMNAWLPVWLDPTDAARFDIPNAAAGSPVLLLTTPDDRLLHGYDDATVLAMYQRLVDAAEPARLLRDQMHWPDAELDRRFRTLPEPVRREVRFVLAAEYRLPENATDAEACRAFIPTYLELLANRPDAVGDYFPLLHAKNISTDALLDAFTRPPAKQAAHHPEPSHQPSVDSPAGPVGDHRNRVRAAIEYYRRPEDRTLAVGILRDGLGHDLARVLEWDDCRRDRWKAALASLLPHTTGAAWTPATKALYELQKLTHDLSRPLYAVAPFEWVRSLGKKPVRQPLDKGRDVILLRHLAKAEKRLERVPLSESERHEAGDLFRHERHAAEGRIRRTLEPILTAAITRAGLVPTSRVETIARDKLVAELIEVVFARGFFRLSDLRDAIARNQLKLPDVAGPRELWAGDALLKADKLLADELFGIYQRGEVYLRGIQRMSAAGFGTRIGRCVTLFVLLPFLGAFLTLEFLQHVLHGVQNVVAAVNGTEAGHAHVVTWWSVAVLGGFFLGLIHSPPFRRGVWQGLKFVGSALRTVFLDVPRLLWSSPVVRRVVRNPVTVFLWYNFALPIAAGLIVAAGAILYDLSPSYAVVVGACAFFTTAIILHSPPGRLLYERLAEALTDTGRFIWASLIPGLISWVVWAFREVADAVERVLYSVDEWLRFREGQSEGSLWLKTVLAVLWFPIAYVTRFVFYLLVEPQVNPVKHFPVVTVSHKVIWPMVPQLSALFGVSNWTMGMIVNAVPGIFGFIAWELKENWRLYAANRSHTLRPVPIGHHGETMRGLLRPGFHSGTVPKLFRKLRANHEESVPSDRKTHQLHHELDHAREAIRKLVERELLPLVGTGSVGVVTVGCQRVEVEIANGPSPLVLGWELDGDEVRGEVVDRGWLAAADEKRVLAALDGLWAVTAVRGRPVEWNEWVKFWETSPVSLQVFRLKA
jgi:hypothetical protein